MGDISESAHTYTPRIHKRIAMHMCARSHTRTHTHTHTARHRSHSRVLRRLPSCGAAAAVPLFARANESSAAVALTTGGAVGAFELRFGRRCRVQSAVCKVKDMNRSFQHIILLLRHPAACIALGSTATRLCQHLMRLFPTHARKTHKRTHVHTCRSVGGSLARWEDRKAMGGD